MLRMIAIHVFLALCLADATPGFAQTLDRIAPPAAAIAAVVPDRDRAQRRQFRQLLWTGVATGLTRRTFIVQDPFAGENHDLIWQPGDAAGAEGGPITGVGALTWRRTGSPRHGAEGLVAQYRGEVVDGILQGYGTYVHVDGLRYDGDWHAGMMHGQGALRLPGGDVYRGGFVDGLPHGDGLRLDATGAVHEGRFAAGLRHGPGLERSPDGNVFAAVWRGGTELPGQRGPAPDDWRFRPAQAIGDTVPGVLLRVAPSDVPSFCCQLVDGAIGYTSTPRPGKLEVFPDAPRLMEIWTGQANIVVEEPLGFNDGRWLSDVYTFGNYDDDAVIPLTLSMVLQNDTRSPLSIRGAHIEVDESREAPRPLLQATELTPLSLASVAFSIENYGLAPAEDVVLNFRFLGPAGALPGQSLDIGTVAGIDAFSFAPALAEHGIAPDSLAQIETFCADRNRETCFEVLRRSALLGAAAPFVHLGDRAGVKYGLRFEGELSYRWRDADGRDQSSTAPFNGFMPLGALFSRGECEGGFVRDLTRDVPFDLRIGQGPYRIDLGLAETVPQGAVDAWRFAVDADRNSRHVMRVVVELTDRRQIVSRDLDILFLRPTQFPTAVRPPQARC
ncbi:MAG: hypothetical protein AAF366_00170 [Pseudomonadota bacterium]